MAVVTEDEFRRFLDQKLFEISSVIMRHYDYCQLAGSSCKAGDPNPCCKGCKFMVKNKCLFDNCDCGLWLCETAMTGGNQMGIIALKKLEEIAELYGLSRPPFIGREYTGADK